MLFDLLYCRRLLVGEIVFVEIQPRSFQNKTNKNEVHGKNVIDFNRLFTPDYSPRSKIL